MHTVIPRISIKAQNLLGLPFKKKICSVKPQFINFSLKNTIHQYRLWIDTATQNSHSIHHGKLETKQLELEATTNRNQNTESA